MKLVLIILFSTRNLRLPVDSGKINELLSFTFDVDSVNGLSLVFNEDKLNEVLLTFDVDKANELSFVFDIDISKLFEGTGLVLIG